MAASVANLRHEYGNFTASRMAHALAPVLSPSQTRGLLAALGVVTSSVCLHGPAGWCHVRGSRASQVLLAVCAGTSASAALLFEALRWASLTTTAMPLEQLWPSNNLVYEFEARSAAQIRSLTLVSTAANELLQIAQVAACAGAALGAWRACSGFRRNAARRRRRVQQVQLALRPSMERTASAPRVPSRLAVTAPPDAGPAKNTRAEATGNVQGAGTDHAWELMDALLAVATEVKRQPIAAGRRQEPLCARQARSHLAALSHSHDAAATLKEALRRICAEGERDALRRGVAALDRWQDLREQRGGSGGVWRTPLVESLRAALREA